MNEVTVEGTLSADPELVADCETGTAGCWVHLKVAQPGRARVHGPIIIPVLATGDDAQLLIDHASRGATVSFKGRLDSSEIWAECGPCHSSLSVWVHATSVEVLPF